MFRIRFLFLLISCHFLYSYENLEHLEHQYEWMDELIDREFKAWSEIDNRRVKGPIPDGFLRVTILNGKPHFSGPLPPPNSQEYLFFDLMTVLCKTYPVPNVDFLYRHHDGMTNSVGIGIPVFAGCRRGDIPDVILFGDWNFNCKEWEKFTEELTNLAKSTPWESRKSQIFWRGKNSDGFYYNHNLNQYSRGSAVLASVLFPEIIDAKFYAPCDGRTHEPLQFQFMGAYLPPFEHIHYKYQLVITGALGSYPNDRWKMFTGSTIFWVPHNEVLWYHYPLKPYIHYIPTTANPSDLKAAYEWAEQNPHLAKQIAENAVSFAKNNLQTSHFLLYMYKTLKKYASLCKYPVQE